MQAPIALDIVEDEAGAKAMLPLPGGADVAGAAQGDVQAATEWTGGGDIGLAANASERQTVQRWQTTAVGALAQHQMAA